VLVTGAEGFIGSTLLDRLLSEGADVRAFVHYKPYGQAGYLAGKGGDVDICPGDVRDPERVATAVEGREVVFHLAALIGIPYSYLAPESYVQTNVMGAVNVAQACRRFRTALMVLTSTSETYGTALTAPIAEDHPLQPQSPYAASKIAADCMALSFHHSFSLPVTVVRPFNTYGPRQSTRAVIPTILAQLHSGVSNIRLGRTAPTRDFTFVEDTVSGILAVAQCSRAIGEVVNIGTGREISIGDLARLLVEISGREAAVVTDDRRLRPPCSEVDRLRCDNSRARRWTGWEPRYSLEQGLQITSEWVRDNLERFAAADYTV